MSLTEDYTNHQMISWNGIRIEKAKMIEFCRSHNMITWYINERCNFHCSYCSVWQNKDKQGIKPIDIINLSESLNNLQKEWIIYITGGEPFLEKNFVDICREITKKHYLAYSTNLSLSNVFDFADTINPEKTLYINASVHIAEREKTDVKLSSYIEKMLYLQKKGFNVIAAYVSHPDLIYRMKSDFEYLKTSGIEKVRVKSILGYYNGKFYPAAFSSEQKEFLKSMEADYPEFEILDQTLNFHGNLCLAGRRAFAMDRNGHLKRCSSTLTNHGNFFEKSIIFDAKTRPCPQNKYACIHECIENNLGTKGSAVSILQEDYIEKLLISKPKGYNSNKFGIFSGALLEKAGIPFSALKKADDIVSKKYIINEFWQMIGAMEKAGIPFSKIKKVLKKK